MSQIDRAYSEKRDYIRMRMEAKMTLHHAGQEIPALCLDLSSTGMQVEATSRWVKKSAYRLPLTTTNCPDSTPRLKWCASSTWATDANR